MFTSLLQSFGLDISDLSAKLVCIKNNIRNEREISSWASCDFPQGAIVEGEIVQQEQVRSALHEILNKVSTTLTTPYVVASLPESKTFIKVIELENEQADIANGVENELPNHIPLPLDELIIDWQVVKEFKDHKLVLVGAVPKVIVYSYTALFNELSLKPIAFEIEAEAILRAITPLTRDNQLKTSNKFVQKLFRFYRHTRESVPATAPVPAAQLIVDLGATHTSLIMVDWNAIQFTSSVALSGVEATQRIADRLKLTSEEAERAKHICGLDAKKGKGVVAGVLEGMLTNCAVEIERALHFYETHFPRGNKVQKILLTGGGAKLTGAETFLGTQLSLPVALGNPLVNINAASKSSSFPKHEALSYATAIGLGLRNNAEKF
ncbi:MAG: type IV pilus assembly protein PilM [Patescibacteria group bacterium]